MFGTRKKETNNDRQVDLEKQTAIYSVTSATDARKRHYGHKDESQTRVTGGTKEVDAVKCTRKFLTRDSSGRP